jgi:hypothetical protein
MDTLLLEYLFSQPALADRLLEEEIESPTKSKKILPVSLQISIAHMSPWLWPEDLSKQIEMMVYYINHIRPIVRHIFCELQGLKSNESAPF